MKEVSHTTSSTPPFSTEDLGRGEVFIKSMASISPQKTVGEKILSQVVEYHSSKLSCIEPDYALWIDSKSLRRMSRIIRMGVTAAAMALKDAKVVVPDAIITGTGYGCLEDTATFLSKMVALKEEALNPTPFIQSTHNTIGGQIALMLSCEKYNQTYAHGAFSFENSLLDGMLHVKENPEQNILVGGVDEITDSSHTILKRFDIFKDEGQSNLNILKNSKGTLNGEGAAFFVLSGLKSDSNLASIHSVATFYKPAEHILQTGIERFLQDANFQPHDIDLVLMGACGDNRYDETLITLSSKFFPLCSRGFFKHLCGEYPVASSFALWLAASMMGSQHIPDTLLQHDAHRPLRRVLIFNQYFGTHYSLMLLNSCRETI